MTFEVRDGSAESVRVLPEQSNRRIARTAQQGSDLAAVVVVVHGQTSSPRLAAADAAAPALVSQTTVVLVRGHFVLPIAAAFAGTHFARSGTVVDGASLPTEVGEGLPVPARPTLLLGVGVLTAAVWPLALAPSVANGLFLLGLMAAFRVRLPTLLEDRTNAASRASAGDSLASGCTMTAGDVLLPHLVLALAQDPSTAPGMAARRVTLVGVVPLTSVAVVRGQRGSSLTATSALVGCLRMTAIAVAILHYLHHIADIAMKNVSGFAEPGLRRHRLLLLPCPDKCSYTC